MRISLLPIAIVLLLSFSVYDDAVAAPECSYMGAISQKPEFDEIFESPFFLIGYEDVALRLEFNKLNRCEVAAGILIFFRREEAPVSYDTILVPVHILMELRKYPPNHIYLKVLREADKGKDLKDRVMQTANFFGGVVNAIPALKKMLH